MHRLIALVVALAGCSAPTTAVVVHVEAAAGLSVMALKLKVAVDGKSPLEKPVPASGRPSFPLSARVELADVATNVNILATATLDDGTTITATSSIMSAPRQQRDVSLTLGASNNGDGGSGDVCHTSGGLTACAGKGYLICDGFEDALDFQPPWYIRATPNPQTQMTIVTSPPPCRGMHAAQAHAVGGDQDAYMGQHPSPALPSDFTQRMFVYLPASQPIVELGLLAFFLDPQGDQLILTLLSDNSLKFYRSFGTELSFAATIPRDRWFCLETTVHLGAAASGASAGHLTVRIDEQVVRDQDAATVGPNGGYNTVFAGIHLTPTNFAGSFDVFMDEFVLAAGSTPVGCH